MWRLFFLTRDLAMNSFKLSPRTKMILKNFSRINPALLFRPGQELRTVSPNKDLVAVAKITETIPARFVIYDLNRFLKWIGDGDHVLIPHEDYLEIKGTDASYKYHFTPENMVLSAPEKDLEIELVITRFELPNVDLQKAIKVLSISSHPEVRFTRENNILTLESNDPQKINLDLYSNELSNDDKGMNFKARLKIEKLMALFPTDYMVSIVSLGDSECATFQNEGDTIKYYVALNEFAC